MDSGVTAAVWGEEKYLTNPRGVPIPPRPRLAHAGPEGLLCGPEGLGCNRR